MGDGSLGCLQPCRYSGKSTWLFGPRRALLSRHACGWPSGLNPVGRIVVCSPLARVPWFYRRRNMGSTCLTQVCLLGTTGTGCASGMGTGRSVLACTAAVARTARAEREEEAERRAGRNAEELRPPVGWSGSAAAGVLSRPCVGRKAPTRSTGERTVAASFMAEWKLNRRSRQAPRSRHPDLREQSYGASTAGALQRRGGEHRRGSNARGCHRSSRWGVRQCKQAAHASPGTRAVHGDRSGQWGVAHVPWKPHVWLRGRPGGEGAWP
jgi:hypothetical protein